MVILWNPVNRKFKILPDSHRVHRFRSTFSHMSVEFRFNHKTVDFKVVQLLYDWNCDRVAANRGLNFRKSRLSRSVDEKSLTLFTSYSDNASDRWDVWLMNKLERWESWMKKYRIVRIHRSVPLKFVNNGEDLLEMNDENLVLVDIEKEEIKNLEVCGLPFSFYTAGCAKLGFA
ncbi:F-box domain-containing protein [Abeliophyllum distichum]|uniref:F-box domain-containing protein n=1 Tax=Abeliophyllum distichum TaxID=126358 RepID=A0ABD1RR56_9LAMI